MSEKPVEDISLKEAHVVNDNLDKNGKTTTESNVPTTSDLSDPNQEHSENVHYEGDICIYTDPVSKFQYVWNSEKSEWAPRTNTDEEENNLEVESSSLPSTVSSKDYKFDGESYIYVDKKTGVMYKYDSVNNKWIEKSSSASSKKKKEGSVESDSDEDSAPDNVVRQDMSGQYSYDGDSHLYTDPNDGTVYVWDQEKNAWFPKVDEDFLAHYQMNYGFTETKDPAESKVVEEEEEKEEESSVDEKELKRKAAAREPAWFDMDDQFNTKVYVSNLPLDITEEEFVAVMQKCGLVMRDLETGKMKVKLYTEPGTNHLKGDALCTYIKVCCAEVRVAQGVGRIGGGRHEAVLLLLEQTGSAPACADAFRAALRQSHSLASVTSPRPASRRGVCSGSSRLQEFLLLPPLERRGRVIGSDECGRGVARRRGRAGGVAQRMDVVCWLSPPRRVLSRHRRGRIMQSASDALH